MKKTTFGGTPSLAARNRRLPRTLQHCLGHKNIQHTVGYGEVAVDRGSVAGVSSLCDFCNAFDLLNLGHHAEVLFP
jgi:hypothetical protein